MIDAIRAWWLTGLAMLRAGFLLFGGLALIADPDRRELLAVATPGSAQ